MLPVDSEEGMHKNRKPAAARVLGAQEFEPNLPALETLRTISNTRSVLAVYLVPLCLRRGFWCAGSKRYLPNPVHVASTGIPLRVMVHSSLHGDQIPSSQNDHHGADYHSIP